MMLSDGALVAAVAACWWFGRMLQHRAAYESAMGNILRPTATLNGMSTTGQILQRAVARHDNTATVCLFLARICAASAWGLLAALLWRVF